MEVTDPIQEVKSDQSVQKSFVVQSIKQKGYFFSILTVIVVVLIVGAGAYFVSTRQVTLPTPSPIPSPISTTITNSYGTQTINLEAVPKVGPPPLQVGFGVFFNENPNDSKVFNEYSIDYGDGSHDSIQQYCWRDTGETPLPTSTLKCQVRASHMYLSSGTFTAILYGISAGGSSKTLGTAAITIGNRLNVTRTVGEKESSFLIQKINQDSVEGLWYQSYPVAGGEGTPKTLHIKDDIGSACEGVSVKLTKIDYSGQTVTFTETWNKPTGECLICLAGNTLIDTPSGLVSVRDLQIGMPIWTTDKAGHRIFGIVTKTSKIPVPPIHQMIHLVLDDGRQLFASPGHPTIDGRSVGDLMAGNKYDGASIVSTHRVPYNESSTYDILPSGETGFYWANGVLLGSTLRSK